MFLFLHWKYGDLERRLKWSGAVGGGEEKNVDERIQHGSNYHVDDSDHSVLCH